MPGGGGGRRPRAPRSRRRESVAPRSIPPWAGAASPSVVGPWGLRLNHTFLLRPRHTQLARVGRQRTPEHRRAPAPAWAAIVVQIKALCCVRLGRGLDPLCGKGMGRRRRGGPRHHAARWSTASSTRTNVRGVSATRPADLITSVQRGECSDETLGLAYLQ